MGRRHGVLEQRGAEISELQQVANIAIGTIVCDNVAPCALESAAKQAAPRTMTGGRARNLNRIPSIDPFSVLQIAGVITQPYSWKPQRAPSKDGLIWPVEFREMSGKYPAGNVGLSGIGRHPIA
jgi:hypothetical protein